MPRRLMPVILVLLLAGAVVYALVRSEAEPTPAARLAERSRTFESNDWLGRACALPQDELVRLWRGHHDLHSEDVTIVPLSPNYSGSFDITSHSGPWDYLQNVPLVFYGPDQVRAAGIDKQHASLVDVAPSVNELTGSVVDLPEANFGVNEAESLEVHTEGAAPKLIVTVVWDGVGRNVLNRWPDRWPNLARMEREGTSFLNATVGSSPSITPATHTTLGTGLFPTDHGITAIEFRDAQGRVRGVFPSRDPSDLEIETFADVFDRALGNRPLVGMLAWKSWHMGMMGHGAQVRGGDADQLALIGADHRLTGNDDHYSTPDYLVQFPGLQDRAEELDRSDGEADGRWRGHDVLEKHDNPAWVRWQTDALIAMLDREGYGTDHVPDLFFTNYKPTDIVAHQHSMDSAEMGDTLEAQDLALGRLVDFLDEKVGDYVVIVTADHGNTPPPQRSGAWPLLQGQLQEDVDAHFGAVEESLIRKTTAAGPFLREDVVESLDVTAADVADFLNGYTIADNYPQEELPEGYEERGNENILAAAYPSDRIGAVLECAFGSRRPPSGLDV